MTYNIQHYPWCIIRPFPNMRTQIVGRFRRRGDAEAHLQILKQLIPGVAYEIIFDITPEPTDSENITPQQQSKAPFQPSFLSHAREDFKELGNRSTNME